MADNFAVNPPTAGGKTFSSKEVSGVHHPHSVLETTVDGVPTPVSDDAPVPVAVAALPLPVDAASETTLSALGSVLVSILSALAGIATASLQSAGNTVLTAIDSKLGGTLTVGLPTGASTSAKQDTGNTSLAAIDTKLGAALPLPTGAATAARQDTGNTSLAAIDTKLTSAATAARQDTGNTSLAAIDTKLTSAATSAKQDTGNTSLGSIDTKLTSVATSAKQDTGNASLAAIDTKLGAALPLPTGASTAARQDTGNTSLAAIDTKLGSALPLPTGAATAARQDTGNASLAALQACAAGTELQVDVLTLPSVTVGTCALPAGAATLAEQQTQSTALAAIKTSVELIDNAVSGASLACSQSGAWNVTNITGTVSLPTGASTLVEQQSQTTHLGTLAGCVSAARAAVNPIAGQVGVQAGAGAVSALTQRMVLATDDPAVASLAVIDDWDEADRAKVNLVVGQAGVDGGSGAVSGATQRVTLATDVALPAGTNAIGKLAANSGVDIGDVDVVALTGSTIAHGDADSGNPHKVGFRAVNALPTAEANNDRVNGVADLWGRQLTAQIDPAMQKHCNKSFTTTQTGADVITPTSGKKLAITSIILGGFATTAARCILWFGDNADTTFTQDTDQVAAAVSFAPTSSSKPGVVVALQVPIFCTTADRELHITTDAGLSVDVTIEYYEW